VSFAHHNGTRALARTARQMADTKMCLAKARATQHVQLRQRLLTWSEHVRSWVDAPGIRVHVVRYEDMKRDPERTFGEAARFAGLPHDPDRVRKAVAFSRFEEVRQQERKHGFNERMPRSRSFFRKGEAGSWRGVLSDAVVARIVRDHAEVMRRFGYLGADGELRCGDALAAQGSQRGQRRGAPALA
jgi:Sulfotransferase domain